MTDATATWRRLIRDVLLHGDRTEQASAGAAFRGRTSIELLAHRTVWPMLNPVVVCPGRKLGYRLLAAEAAWILSGDNRLATIVPYARQYAKLSDDGIFLSGAYGPPFVEQLPYVVGALLKEPSTRQAVMTIWRPRPGSWADVPCTTTLQWLLRDKTLHCVATMRSSDVWLGIPYDVHTFSMMSATVLLYLPRNWGLSLGNLYLTAGSQHLYLLDRENAEACAARDDRLYEIRQFESAEFETAGELTSHLWAIARREGEFGHRWLTETVA